MGDMGGMWRSITATLLRLPSPVNPLCSSGDDNDNPTLARRGARE
eukprot:CAMPEP_0183314942 /NCGR_PEP_ID=MMETSP0160_2-20130417/50181_1 /TAXON_ID=2839 ORGANISM="Odontella Sinensis, Strain Grunow 1884" /NCGR_SAMPLE_ID=MMETSP0160_2 /ASSEMBLY_ACC=CAM_ASM_000250 /LENGTH=44 /DNA_ID= /DNA_START= /DNA_END= /DNA_ORIENTATION=